MNLHHPQGVCFFSCFLHHSTVAVFFQQRRFFFNFQQGLLQHFMFAVGKMAAAVAGSSGKHGYYEQNAFQCVAVSVLSNESMRCGNNACSRLSQRSRCFL